MQRQIVIMRGKTAIEQNLAQSLASTLPLPLVEEAGNDASLVLAFVSDRLELREAGTRPGRGLSIEFGSADGRAVRVGSHRRQPLARAIGEASTVLDATAGLGRDAWLLASMGFHVIAVERSPIVAALLDNGLRRARMSEELDQRVVSRIRIMQGDARDIITENDGTFEAIYIDPMFPPKTKSTALAKKSVRMLRDVVGDDPDAGSLLDAARASSAGRIVVKRADDAPALGSQPSFAVHGKLVRYDVYTRQQMGSGSRAHE
jgi:16S rRNA (guanine1516-N2)-methyltransferase